MLAGTTAATAQVTSASVEIHFIHDGQTIPELAGYVTYRVYVNTEHADDFVSSLVGLEAGGGPCGVVPALSLQIANGSVYQHGQGGCLPTNCPLAEYLEALNYDSFLTIGTECPVPGISDINPLFDYFLGNILSPATCTAFEAGNGFSDPEGALFTVQDFLNGWAGDDNKVLIAQFTTNAPWEFSFGIQGQVNGTPGPANTFCFNGNVSSEDASFPGLECLYDFDSNGIVGYNDLLMLLTNGSCTDSECPGDLNGDMIYDYMEMVIFLGFYGTNCGG